MEILERDRERGREREITFPLRTRKTLLDLDSEV